MITIREHLAWQLSSGDKDKYMELTHLFARLRAVRPRRKKAVRKWPFNKEPWN